MIFSFTKTELFTGLTFTKIGCRLAEYKYITTQKYEYAN